MSTGGEFERRLTTVLYADVHGYTKLTEDDEAGTHQVLRESLRLVGELVSAHGGTIAHYAGDAVLAEFSSVIDGLNCAVEVQRSINERNATVPESPRISFRIGVNIGDVIADEGEIYGDAVNTAVRLQSLAEPGGICLSEAVRNAIGKHLPIAYEFLGEEHLKNLSTPVRAYRVVLGTEELVQLDNASGWKPSVAVMPFENLGDASQERFVDRFTQDVTRELSRFRGFVVLAHNSTFAYKGRPTNVQQLADELGVEIIVEGHVQRTADRLRANVELVDALSGGHIWSELYDRHANGHMVVHDAVIRELVAAIAGRLHKVGSDDALRRPSEQLRPFDHVLRGQALVGKGAKRNALSRVHYQRALALDPDNARAFAGIALSFVDDWLNGLAENPSETLTHAFEAAQKAYSLDNMDSKAHWVLGLVQTLRGDLDQAERVVERAVELNANDADCFAVQALIWINRGDGNRAQHAVSTAFTLNPFPSAWYKWLQGVAHYVVKEADEARFVLLEAIQQNPDLNAARAFLVVVYVDLGDEESACREAKELLRRIPNLTGNALVELIPVPTSDHGEQLLAAFRTANIPE